ncbi:MAG: enoyl-CoA hydratase-related protein [Proteobacteria bacterium]|nr:enoyl-CoA hydratase-related protein [Pseudomonadota bacterium]
MADPLVLYETDKRGVAWITMNRPDRHNAFNDDLVVGLESTLANAASDDAVRVIVLRGAGKSFSAGADLDAMRAAGSAGREDNIASAIRWATMLRNLASSPKPTIAVIQGAAIAGGVGLTAACDVALSTRGAQFGVSEVRLGIMPAIISPYVLAAIGARNARRYFLTAERFDGEQACRLGLVHQIAEDEEELNRLTDEIIDAYLLSAPGAVRDTKGLSIRIGNGLPDDDALGELAGRLADRRASEEGQEGLAAFFEKRAASWVTAD